VIHEGKKENSPHFAEDLSFINNKSNTCYGDEASSLLETISAMKDKDLRKGLNLDGSYIKESSEEATNDKSKSHLNDEKIRTPELPARKSTAIKNLTEETTKNSQSLIENLTNNSPKNTRTVIQDQNENKNEKKNENDEKNQKNENENENDEKNEKNDNNDPKIDKKEENDKNVNNNAEIIEKTQVVQPKIIDRARQRKEEFEKKMKEKQPNENKLQALKQKFQATQPIKEPIQEENNNKGPLISNEVNVGEEKTTDFDALERNLKKQLADLQKPEEIKVEILKNNDNLPKQTDENKTESNNLPNSDNNGEKNVISLKGYREQMKLKKTGTDFIETKPENKYFINNRGQKINKNLSGIIEQLEKKFGGSMEIVNNRESEGGNGNNMEHLTLERSKMGHKRMKSKNSDFFDLI